MKKFTSLMTALLITVSVTGYAASQGMKSPMDGQHKPGMGHQGHKMAMKHANPLPNFMKVIKKHGDQLALTQEQSAALEAWRNENKKAVHDLANSVTSAEAALHDAAFTNAAQADLQDLMDKVLHLRLQLAQRKMRCRENMRTVLNEDQWKQVVSLYQDKVLAQQ